jgi:hypothetical protein
LGFRASTNLSITITVIATERKPLMIHTLTPAGTPVLARIPRSLPEVRAAGPAGRLRTVLTLNAATSGVIGVVGLAAGQFWATKLGIDSAPAIRVVCAALIVFAIEVVIVAFRSTTSLNRWTAAISAIDIAWILGTVAIVTAAELTALGTVVAIVLGVGVAAFAALQLWFRSRNN